MALQIVEAGSLWGLTILRCWSVLVFNYQIRIWLLEKSWCWWQLSISLQFSKSHCYSFPFIPSLSTYAPPAPPSLSSSLLFLLYSPGWPSTHEEPPISASWALELEVTGVCHFPWLFKCSFSLFVGLVSACLVMLLILTGLSLTGMFEHTWDMINEYNLMCTLFSTIYWDENLV